MTEPCGGRIIQITLHYKAKRPSLRVREYALSPDERTIALVEWYMPIYAGETEALCRIRLRDCLTGWSCLIRASLGRDCRVLGWSQDGHLLFFTRRRCTEERAALEWLAYDVHSRRLLRLPA